MSVGRESRISKFILTVHGSFGIIVLFAVVLSEAREWAKICSGGGKNCSGVGGKIYICSLSIYTLSQELISMTERTHNLMLENLKSLFIDKDENTNTIGRDF